MSITGEVLRIRLCTSESALNFACEILKIKVLILAESSPLVRLGDVDAFGRLV